MQIIPFQSAGWELPLKAQFSLEPLFKDLETLAGNTAHPYHSAAKTILERANQFPELRTGIEDFDQLEKYGDVIELLTEPLFPKGLQNNEIKALMIPFTFLAFRPTQRFSQILKDAGDGFNMDIADFDTDNFYRMVCSFILGKYYGKSTNFTRPLFVEIPDQQTGILRHYRILLNADYNEVFKTDKAPTLTEAEINELIMRADDLDLWKSKIPPNSYIFRGFTIMNLYDATLDVAISRIRSLFLRLDQDVYAEFQENLRMLYGIKDLQLGYSVYDTQNQQLMGEWLKGRSQSVYLDEGKGSYNGMYCDMVEKVVMQHSETLAIADVDVYGQNTGENPFSKKLKARGIQSLILAPIRLDNGLLQVLELASPRPYELNSLNAIKLQDITPFMKIAAERYFKERENLLESTIQENYTSIHPSVKWRFDRAARSFIHQKAAGKEMPILEEIVFENIYPLFGQSDIKGSSTARNEAIQADLELQLSLVIDTFKKVMALRPLPIYKKLIFRINNYLGSVKEGLKAGDEVGILEFLKHEIYPGFHHLKTLDPVFKQAVEEYMAHIDPILNVVYKERKAYEDSVTILNEKLSALLDQRQEEAQAMFPHYFQRYNTDGVEYNMYIGASLLENQPFDPIYLHNLRLWQLETMWDIEQKAHELEHAMPHPLKVASLILIHSTPLAIKFKMDEKQFDVDGAYNARYEIIKKRIDKSYVKGTNERLTQPGKIAIIYSQDRDALEYQHYLEYLQAEHKFGEVEMLDIEDLQGVSGLKAMRVEVLYKQEKGRIENRVRARRMEDLV